MEAVKRDEAIGCRQRGHAVLVRADSPPRHAKEVAAGERWAGAVDSEIRKRLAHARGVRLERFDAAKGIVRERILVLDVVRAAALEWRLAHPRAQPGLHNVIRRLQLARHESSGTPSIGDEASA